MNKKKTLTSPQKMLAIAMSDSVAEVLYVFWTNQVSHLSTFWTMPK
jgi:hypothetical protein